MSSSNLPLSGRVALVTGVSRQRGIGFAVARRLGQLGARLFLHGFTPYDRSLPSGAGAEGTEALAEKLGEDGIVVAHLEADFLDAHAPREVMNAAVAAHGRVDMLIANHTHSTPTQLLESVNHGQHGEPGWHRYRVGEPGADPAEPSRVAEKQMGHSR